MTRFKILLPSLCVAMATPLFAAQKFVTNYDEAKVPQYTLPELLVLENGEPVQDAKTWNEKRRTELLELFKEYMFGHSPGPVPVSGEVVETDTNALDGLAIRKQIELTLGSGENQLPVDLVLYLPKHAKKPVPIFLGLNFHGNHTIDADPALRMPRYWVKNEPTTFAKGHLPSEKGRGTLSRRWPLKTILERGYGVATICYGDIDPDFNDGFKNGVHGLFPENEKNRNSANWGAIAGWAWGLSRAMDYLETVDEVDAKRVAVIGHSRLGKTSLWAGAQDPRFAMAISNDSGCGGAAISRRKFGETLEVINSRNPHWFCENFHQYNKREEDLPLDQHELIALIAPRPVYVASASEDKWADPRGEYLAAKAAEPAYQLFGKEGLPLDEFPAPGEGAFGSIGYHLRPGKHDIIEYDWLRFLDFADKHFK